MIIANEGGREGPSRNQWIVVLLAAAHFLSPGPAAGQTPRDRPSDALHQLKQLHRGVGSTRLPYCRSNPGHRDTARPRTGIRSRPTM